MKKTALIFLTFICVSLITQAQENYHIIGHIKGAGNAMVYLGNKPRGTSAGFKYIIHDSVRADQGHFEFKGELPETGIYSIDVPSKSKSWFSFILNKNPIHIDGKIDSVYKSKITGDNETQIFDESFANYIKLIQIQVHYQNQTIFAKRDKNPKLQVYIDSAKLLRKNRNLFIRNLIQQHPNSFVGLNMLNIFQGTDTLIDEISADSCKVYLDMLGAKIKKNSLYKKLLFQVTEGSQLLKEGVEFPNFKMNDAVGKSFNFDSLKGKYVILDIWASWCGPCEEQIPHLKKIYQKYRSKGLEVVSVSIDVEKQNWLTAISKHQLPWIQLSDLQGNSGALYSLLQINSIPKYYLISNDGVLLLKEAELDKIEKRLIQEFK